MALQENTQLTTHSIARHTIYDKHSKARQQWPTYKKEIEACQNLNVDSFEKLLNEKNRYDRWYSKVKDLHKKAYKQQTSDLQSIQLLQSPNINPKKILSNRHCYETYLKAIDTKNTLSAYNHEKTTKLMNAKQAWRKRVIENNKIYNIELNAFKKARRTDKICAELEKEPKIDHCWTSLSRSLGLPEKYINALDDHDLIYANIKVLALAKQLGFTILNWDYDTSNTDDNGRVIFL